MSVYVVDGISEQLEAVRGLAFIHFHLLRMDRLDHELVLGTRHGWQAVLARRRATR